MATSSPVLSEVFERYRDRVDEALRAVLDHSDSPLSTMAQYQLGWVDEAGKSVCAMRGKALRPTLCLVTCEGLGGDVTGAIPAAAAIELLHQFSLVHDDVMDNDRLRRSRPTVWAVWGPAKAIDVGDFMHVLATLSMLRAGDIDSPGAVRDAVEVLALGCKRMTEGQYFDMAFEEEGSVTVDAYLDMVDGKSAALFAAAMELGAIFAGNDAVIRESVRNVGAALGAAFQIRDDILGIWGDPDKTGKSVQSDIQKRKKTLPIVHALTTASDADRELLRSAFADQDAVLDTTEIVALLGRAGSREYAESLVLRYHAVVRERLAEIQLSAWGFETLEAVAAFAAVRSV